MFNKNVIRILLLLVIAFHSSHAISALNTILADQNFTYLGNDGKLVVNFQTPMGYISHFPAKKGKTLKLRLKELIPAKPSTARLTESLSFDKSKNNPVLEIKYEKANVTAKSGVLTIEFNRSVEFDIKLSRDRRSLALSLNNLKPKTSSKSRAKSINTGLPIYTINLMTSKSPIDVNDQPALVNFKTYDIYVTETIQQWKPVYTLHVGYFYSPSAANANLERLKPFYPQGWVSKIPSKQRSTAETWFFDKKIKKVKQRKKTTTVTKKPEKIDILMERARQAMLDNNYKQAIRLFTRILQLGGGDFKKESKELLGLARERNGQFAHAKAEYQEYLKLYPEGEDAERVKQRLLGLLTARSQPKDKLKKGVKGAEPEWEFFGSLFQFYRNQTNSTDTTSGIETDSSLLSDILYTGRKRGIEYNQRFDLAGSHRFDFLNDTDKSDGRVQTFYYEISKRDDNHAAKVGRQTHSTDGVFGRFDGVILNKRVSTDKKINFLAGYPVDLGTSDGLNTNRQFFALSYDIEALYKNADFKFYAIDQTNQGLTDRRAVGTQMQYFDDTTTYFASIDYDIFFSELNQITFSGSWRNQQNSSINIVADYRRSPLLTTNNALIGQTVGTIDALRQTFTDDQIYQLARDRTSTYSSLTFAASTFLSERYQLNGDITFSSLGSTVASGGVDALQGTGTESFYNTSLVINNFFTSNDITIFGARYIDAATADVIQLNFSGNFNISKKWRVNPRFIADFRDNASGSSRTSYKPRVIANYRPSRSLKYELDIGYEDAETEGMIATTTESSLYIFIGYIYDF